MSDAGRILAMDTVRREGDWDAINAAVQLLRAGKLVVMPTETVYGLAADATNEQAVAEIYARKNRPEFNPLIIHCAGIVDAERIGMFNPEATALAKAFWPGAMTLVMPYDPRGNIADLARAGGNTIAIRIPAHPVARRLLATLGRPVAAPSANISGRISPTTADHALAELDGLVPFIIDGGPCTVGLESTVIDLTGNQPRILRPGGINAEAIADVLNVSLDSLLADRDTETEAVLSPGRLKSHYAPQTPLVLSEAPLEMAGARDAVLTFGALDTNRDDVHEAQTLSQTGDLVEAAATLFAKLRLLDESGADRIIAALLPDAGLGRAINDRLARAAAKVDGLQAGTEIDGVAPPLDVDLPSAEISLPMTADTGNPSGSAPVDDRSVLDQLREIVGDRNVITDPDDMHPHMVEWRDRYMGKALAVVRPKDVYEVSSVLKVAHKTGTPIVPQGGNTGLVGGQIPFEGGDEIVLSLSRLDRIRDIDAQGNTITVDAGVTLSRLQDAAASMNRLFPLSLGSEGTCQIGGNLATNAGGTAVLAYGNTRELALGLEVVLPDGRIWNGLKKLKKDNTGYDLRDLFIGSEGTLGIITAAVLKMFPAPVSKVTALVGLDSPGNALQLFEQFQAALGSSVTGFEIMPRLGIEFVLKHGPRQRDPLSEPHAWYVLIELSSTVIEALDEGMEVVLGDAFEAGLINDATIARSEAETRAHWQMRTVMSEVQKNEGGSIKHDISVPVASVPDFIRDANYAVEAVIPGARPLPFGHLGDGNIHYNVSQPVGADKQGFLDRWDELSTAVHDVVQHYEGSISAEHGIGRMKREMLQNTKSDVEMDLMRAIKQAIDPDGIMNPGKVL